MVHCFDNYSQLRTTLGLWNPSELRLYTKYELQVTSCTVEYCLSHQIRHGRLSYGSGFLRVLASMVSMANENLIWNLFCEICEVHNELNVKSP